MLLEKCISCYSTNVSELCLAVAAIINNRSPTLAHLSKTVESMDWWYLILTLKKLFCKFVFVCCTQVFKELTTVQGFSSSMTLNNRFEWLIISNKLAKNKIRQLIVLNQGQFLNDTIRWKIRSLFCCKICRIYIFLFLNWI